MEFKTDIREVIDGSESENTTESVNKAKKLSRRTADITKKKREKYRTLLQKREQSGRRTVCSKEKLSEKPCRKGQRRRI
jgi:hypothetical protein